MGFVGGGDDSIGPDNEGMNTWSKDIDAKTEHYTLTVILDAPSKMIEVIFPGLVTNMEIKTSIRNAKDATKLIKDFMGVIKQLVKLNLD